MLRRQKLPKMNLKKGAELMFDISLRAGVRSEGSRGKFIQGMKLKS